MPVSLIVPLPAMLRRVSGMNSTMKITVVIPKMKRNQKMVWKLRNGAIMPPRTGPDD